MTQEDREDIKRYIGVLAEDFQAKLDLVIEGQQMLRQELKQEMHERFRAIQVEIEDIKSSIRQIWQEIRAMKQEIREHRAETQVMDHRLSQRLEHQDAEIRLLKAQ